MTEALYSSFTAVNALATALGAGGGTDAWNRSSTAPTREELETIVHHVERRAQAWLKRRGLIDERPLEERSNEAPAPAALEACAVMAMQRGAVRAVRDDPDAAREENIASVEAPPAKTCTAEHAGYNLEAGVRIEAEDDLGRERLLRYGARSPIALDRLRRLPDGRVAYRIKKWRDGRAKSRIMTPIEFLARLSAIIPPPRVPLIRFHGVLGPKSGWRKDVVPKPPSTRPESCDPVRPHDEQQARKERRNQARRAHSVDSSPASSPHTSAETKPSALAHNDGAPPSDLASVAAAAVRESATPPPSPDPCSLASNIEVLAPNVIGVRHWQHLLGGLLCAAKPRIEWAKLLHRTFEVEGAAIIAWFIRTSLRSGRPRRDGFEDGTPEKDRDAYSGVPLRPLSTIRNTQAMRRSP